MYPFSLREKVPAGKYISLLPPGEGAPGKYISLLPPGEVAHGNISPFSLREKLHRKIYFPSPWGRRCPKENIYPYPSGEVQENIFPFSLREKVPEGRMRESHLILNTYPSNAHNEQQNILTVLILHQLVFYAFLQGFLNTNNRFLKLFQVAQYFQLLP